MHLVTPLASGISGAGSGTATVKRRGTSTDATYYTDFEGQTSATGTVTLDANGGATIYVDTLVDVTAFDSAGTQIRQFTAGVKDSAVEINSQSFTGTSYDDGSGTTTTATSQPTTLKAQADLWLTNNGAIDWKVLFGGSAVTIQAALAGLSGLFVNVKDPTYGAQGDGATDDTSAIQAALDAAGTGGIVIFPEGTYLISSALTFDDTLLWGVHPRYSIITIDHASNNALEYSTTDTASTLLHRFSEIRNLTIKANQANTGNLVSAAAGGIILDNVFLGDGTNAQGSLLNDTGGAQWHIRNCTFVLQGTSQDGANLRNADSRSVIDGCYFTPAAGGCGEMLYLGDARVTNCRFHNSLMTSGTGTNIKVNGNCTIVGNIFEDDGGATVTAIETDTLASGEIMVENGNNFGSSITKYVFTASTDETKVALGSRDEYWALTTDASATVSLDADQFGHIVVERTSGAAITVDLVNAKAQAPEGATFFLTIWNNGTGGNVTLTAGTRMNLAAGGVAVISDNDATTFMFKAMVIGGNADVEWYQVGTAQDVNET